MTIELRCLIEDTGYNFVDMKMEAENGTSGYRNKY